MERDRRIGAFILGAAVLVALLIVGGRLLGGRDAVPQPAPTSAPLPIVPATATLAATGSPATASPPPGPSLAADGGPLADGRRVVCLDPGHGGSDLGNVRRQNGVDLLYEKNFTLPHGLALAERLRAQGLEVVLTREGDTNVNATNQDVNNDGIVAAPGGEATSDELDDLLARVLTCNAAAADLLVSIHYNGAENDSLQGYEVWYNEDRPFSARAARFAALAYEELGQSYLQAGYAAVPHGIGTADHAVTGPARPGKLTPSAMPGAVVEGLYLSNDEDAAFVVSDAAEGTIVGAYERAILRFFDEFPG